MYPFFINFNYKIIYSSVLAKNLVIIHFNQKLKKENSASFSYTSLVIVISQ